MNYLELTHVRKQYGSVTAVSDMNLSVQSGEVYGLLGANGAGKTTTMRMTLGLIYPDSGEIRWKGQPYHQGLNGIMGYLPEERGLYPKIKVSEQLLYLAELRGMKRSDADQQLKLWLEKFNVPEYYHKKVEELSKGNQQKIQFIAAIIHRPEILILDEAFSGLDPVNVELLKRTVKELRGEGTAILFSSHRMEHVEELCENMVIMHKSNAVLQGKLRDIKQSFPRERVMLETDLPVNGLEGLAGVEAVNVLANGYEIRIKELEAAQRVLKLAMEQSTVSRFQIMEPSLHEIFIKVVGGEVNE